MTELVAATLTNVTLVTNVMIMLIVLIPTVRTTALAKMGTAAMDSRAPTSTNVFKWKSMTATSMRDAQIPLVHTPVHVLKVLQVLAQAVSTTMNVQLPVTTTVMTKKEYVLMPLSHFIQPGTPIPHLHTL